MRCGIAFFTLTVVAFTAAGVSGQTVRMVEQPDRKPAVVGPPRDEKTQLFRGLLHHFKIEPLSLDEVKYDKGSLVIVLGDPGRSKQIVAGYVRKTLASGGAVLIAADTFLNLSPFFPDGEDLEIVGNAVTDPGGSNSYLGNATCPFVKPDALRAANLRPEEELFSGFDRLATNSPTALRITKRPPYLSRTVGVYHDTVRYTGGNLSIRLKPNEIFAAAGVGRDDDPFRCLVMADHSVLSNDMLYASADPNPTDNFPFAVRLVPWLQGPEKRSRCLFIEAGVVQTRFDEFDFSQVQNSAAQPPIPPMPAPRLPDLMDRKFQESASKVASEVVTHTEDNDSFKNALARDTRAYVAIVSIIVTAAMILASLILRRRIWSARQERNYQPIPADPLRLGGDAPPGSFTHRRLELLRGSDFRAPFGEFVELLFLERGYPEGYRGDRCPRIETPSRNRQYLLDSVRRLWTEAMRNADKPLAYTQWKELEPILAAVRSAADADRWRFAPSPAIRTDSEGAA